MKFVATKKVMTTDFFLPPLCCYFWIRDGKKIRIRDKHPGSATLVMLIDTLMRVLIIAC
jgi:hypothetical protein